MGWTLTRRGGEGKYRDSMYWKGAPDKGSQVDWHWHPSTDIAAAMEVLLTMRERNYGWTIGTHKHGWYVRCFELPDAGLNWRHSVVVDIRLATAICQSALAALEETRIAAEKCGAVAHNVPERNTESVQD